MYISQKENFKIVEKYSIKRIRQLESEKATLEQGIKQAEDNIKLLELQLQYRNEVAKVELKTAEAEREKAEAQRKTAEAQRDKAEAERDKAEAVNMAAMTRVESQAKIAQMEVQLQTQKELSQHMTNMFYTWRRSISSSSGASSGSNPPTPCPTSRTDISMKMMSVNISRETSISDQFACDGDTFEQPEPRS